MSATGGLENRQGEPVEGTFKKGFAKATRRL
jgi:hypothetical protein